MVFLVFCSLFQFCCCYVHDVIAFGGSDLGVVISGGFMFWSEVQFGCYLPQMLLMFWMFFLMLSCCYGDCWVFGGIKFVFFFDWLLLPMLFVVCACIPL